MTFKIGDTVTTSDEQTGTLVRFEKNAFGFTVAVVELYEDGETFEVVEAVKDLS